MKSVVFMVGNFNLNYVNHGQMFSYLSKVLSLQNDHLFKRQNLVYTHTHSFLDMEIFITFPQREIIYIHKGEIIYVCVCLFIYEIVYLCVYVVHMCTQI